MNERRTHIRIDAPLEIWVTLNGNGREETTTINFSDGGAMVRNCFSTVPHIGTEISMQLAASVMGKPAPVLHGMVVRATTEVIACRFVTSEQSA